MGWTDGSGLFRKLVQALERVTQPADAKYNMFDQLVDAFEHQDCDTLYELEGVDEILDQVLRDRGHIEAPEVDESEPTVWMFVHNVRESVQPSQAQMELAVAHIETLRDALRHVCAIDLSKDRSLVYPREALIHIETVSTPDDVHHR